MGQKFNLPHNLVRSEESLKLYISNIFRGLPGCLAAWPLPLLHPTVPMRAALGSISPVCWKSLWWSIAVWINHDRNVLTSALYCS